MAIATLMRPVYGGSVSTFFHVLPASVDLKSAVPFGAASLLVMRLLPIAASHARSNQNVTVE